MDKKTKKELKREKFLKKKAEISSNSSSSKVSTKSQSSPQSSYDPKEIEEKWFKAWEKDGLFKPRPGGEKFTITMPPPNITGSLHIGHSMMIAIQDCLVRYKRMKGYEVLYLPGTDHAGIATQSVVSRKYNYTSRDEFLKAAWDWKEKYGGRIVEQFKRLGASADFTRTRFTMDPEMSEAVEEAFVRLYEKGLIYRESKIVNWCGRLKTTLSDLEVDHQVVKANTFLTVDEGRYEFGVIYEMKYPLLKGDESILVWTTRPETILGDVALCAHPEDPRYKGLPPPINPLTGEELVFIYDSQACREFGTGLLKITPAHDPVDFEIAKRHGLRGVPIFDSDNRVNVPGCLYGLKRYEARKKALDILREKGLLVRKIPYDQTIPICSRSGDVIEPCIKEQWWLKCQEMAKKALEAVRRKEIEIYPPEAEKVWERWLENIRDWCLSRQLWWGHRIPAYTKNGKEWVIKRGRKECDSECKGRKEGSSECKGSGDPKDPNDPNVHHNVLHPNDHPNYTQDEDVLDTWFSSSLWPFATMGWPSSPTTPTSLLETGSDILFFWVARMVMMSLELTGDIPFRKILLHGLVRDAHGRKMSKSLGNVIDPLYVIEGIDLDSLISNMKGGNLAPSEVKMAEKTLRKDFPQGIPKCGADALRFTLLSYTLGMKDINLDILRVEGYRRLCNKLWNAHKYVLMKYGKDSDEQLLESLSIKEDISISPLLPLPVKWLLSRRDRTVEASESALDKFNFMAATQVIHQFFLYDFCDVYIEITKDTKAPLYTRTLLTVFLDILRIFHPYIPFITEEIYHHYSKETIMYSPYPVSLNRKEETFTRFLEFVKVLRSKKPKAIRVLKKSYPLEESYLRSLVKKTPIEFIEDESRCECEDFGFIYSIE